MRLSIFHSVVLLTYYLNLESFAMTVADHPSRDLCFVSLTFKMNSGMSYDAAFISSSDPFSVSTEIEMYTCDKIEIVVAANS